MGKQNEPQQEYNSILDGNAASGPLLSSPMPEKRPLKQLPWKPILKVAAIVAVVLGLLIGGGLYFEYRYEQEYQRNKAEMEAKSPKNVTYFENAQTQPEKSPQKLTHVVTKAYYTNDGSLAVELCIANGMTKEKVVQKVDITIQNGESGATIAEGSCNLVAANATVTVPADGTATMLVYISPEYVKIQDDPLSTIGYTISSHY